ncbi:hypothetical protein K2173_019011 [Erythroxylum novogranatense]|uniref:DUF4283 domain-containing protein n=1 Tax=Erythroxylum novogranatense TaxID=1862640 RepID=A0AAV8ST24_9ROSI|nr:hypothetical protein K2173_019011 [Erythroxylum novogranatense]
MASTTHASKKVRLREQEDDPPPASQPVQSAPPSYSAVVSGSSTQLNPGLDLPWPEDPSIELEEGDITLVQGPTRFSLDLSSTFRTKLDDVWAQAIVIKLLGRRMGFQLLRDRLLQMWHLTAPLKIIDLENDFYLVNFKEERDYIHTLTQGPWIIAGHVLSVQPWSLDFRLSSGRVTHVIAWVRFLGLSIARYHPSILTALGNLVGKTVKIDETTQQTCRGHFARVAVTLDLSAPLRSTVELDGEPIQVAYEGLPQICLHCGRVGHGQDVCPSRPAPPPGSDPPLEASNPNDSGLPRSATTPGPPPSSEFGPWMQVARRNRRPPPPKAGTSLANATPTAADGSRFAALGLLESCDGLTALPTTVASPRPPGGHISSGSASRPRKSLSHLSPRTATLLRCQNANVPGRPSASKGTSSSLGLMGLPTGSSSSDPTTPLLATSLGPPISPSHSQHPS